MFAGLRHHACVRGDDEQYKIDPGGTGDHGADESLVSRYIDDANDLARRQLQVSEAELDGDAARFFFFEAVGVDAR